MSSKECLQYGFVGFATTAKCKRCGAAFSALPERAPAPAVPVRETTGKRRSPLFIYIVGVVVSLLLAALAFGATADYGTTVPLILFSGAFIGGMVLVLVVANYFQANRSGAAQKPSATGRNAQKIIIHMMGSYLVLLPLLLVKLDSGVPSSVAAEKAGELFGVCLIPAIITSVWMRYSKQEWSWTGVGLRYLLLFTLSGFVFVMSILYDKDWLPSK
jgi:hypothetical protein